MFRTALYRTQPFLQMRTVSSSCRSLKVTLKEQNRRFKYAFECADLNSMHRANLIGRRAVHQEVGYNDNFSDLRAIEIDPSVAEDIAELYLNRVRYNEEFAPGSYITSFADLQEAIEIISEYGCKYDKAIVKGCTKRSNALLDLQFMMERLATRYDRATHFDHDVHMEIFRSRAEGAIRHLKEELGRISQLKQADEQTITQDQDVRRNFPAADSLPEDGTGQQFRNGLSIGSSK